MVMTAARFLGVVLALGGASVLSLAADERQEAAEAINKQANDVGKKDWSALSKQGADVAKNHELEDIMNLMKLRRKNPRGPGFVGGGGIGDMPGGILPDGIEAKIINLSKNPMGQA